MNENLAEIVSILDRSGSMEPLWDSTIEGYNTFIAEQKKVPGEARVTLVLFDHEYQELFAGKPLNHTPLLTRENYIPRGGTALLDAIGRTIDTIGVRLSSMAEADRPGKVIFVIVTDGMENSSKEYTRERVFEKITHQRENYQWEFLFLAANQDAIAVGTSLGVAAMDSVNFDSTPGGMKIASASYNTSVTRARTSKKN